MTNPNILLIVLDTARQHTIQELLGSGDVPALERIADEGTQFTSASANGAWTVPTHASIFTGKRISQHGTHAGTKYFDPTNRTLSETMSDAGYRTVGLSGNAWISPEFGFGRGFDQFSMKWDYFWKGADLSPVSSANGVHNKLREFFSTIEFGNTAATVLNSFYANLFSNRYDDGARNITRRTKKWIQERGRDAQPFFYFINYLEPHLEYDPVPEFRDRFLNKVDDDRITSIDQNAWRYIAGKTELTTEDFEILRGLYKAEIAYVDSKIGELYGVLERTGLLENTCIVVVGDHGENIGEHGLMDHQYCLYETLLNVPLIIRYPDGNGGEIVESPVETRDIFPTVLDVADIKLPASNAISDNSLRTSPAREYVISEYRVPQPSMESLEAQVGRLSREVLKYDRALRSVRRREWKLIEGSDGSIELYDLESDPLEYIDCSSEHPQKIELLSSIFDEECVPLSKDPNINAEMSEVSRRQLEDLGYI